MTTQVQDLPQDIAAIYPFEPQEFCTRDGHRLSYLDEGAKDAPVLLCLHGNPTWSFYYRNVAQSLKSKFRVIVPDHIGCGLSEKPQDWDYVLANHIQNIVDLLESLEIKKFSLLVHDWGGAIGMGVATLHVERVEKIILLNTAAFIDSHIPKRIALCRLPLIGAPMVRAFNAFAWPATFMAAQKKLSPAVKRGFLYPYNNYKNRIATALFVQDIPMERDHPSFETMQMIEENLGKLTCPKLILWGGLDFCFNNHFYARWQNIYPDAETHYYPLAGHYVLEDEAEDVIKRVENFLQ